jgi:hypothetical protein
MGICKPLIFEFIGGAVIDLTYVTKMREVEVNYAENREELQCLGPELYDFNIVTFRWNAL